MAVTAAPASAGAAKVIRTSFNNWIVSGSLTLKSSDQTITLPKGSTFNGESALELLTFNGTINGNVFVPNFTTPIQLEGTATPIQASVSFTEDGPSEGVITLGPNAQEPLDIHIISKANLGINAVGLAGVQAPVSCTTSQPVVFELTEGLTIIKLLTQGNHFKGTVTIPSWTCSGLEGAVASPVVTALMSGPDNPYTLNITPPAEEASTPPSEAPPAEAGNGGGSLLSAEASLSAIFSAGGSSASAGASAQASS